MIESLIISLILTLIIELTLALLVNIRDEDNIFTVIFASVVTNPIVVFTVNMINLLNNYVLTRVVVYILEILVVFAEGYIFKKYMKNLKMNPYLFALYLNGFSFFIGEVINIFLIN